MSLNLKKVHIDTIAARISEQWTSWQSKREVNRAKWEEIESYLFATDTLSLNSGMHDHTTHIPITAEFKEELESLIFSAVYPGEDFLGWRPYDTQAASRSKREKILAYIKNRHALNGFDKTLRKLVQDLVIYGNAFVQVVHRSPSTGGYRGPQPIRISPYDIVFDPTATDFRKTPKILRVVKPIGDFHKWCTEQGIEDEVRDEVIQRRYQKSVGTFVDTNKNKQFLPDGFTDIQSYYDSGVVELLFMYGDIYDEESGQLLVDTCYVIADRVTVVHSFEAKDAHIFKASWAEKPDNLWSQGPLDKVIGMNYQINHRENSKSDALDRYIHPDRVFIGDVEEVYDSETGQTRYLAPEGGGVTDLSPDTTVLTADMHIDRLTAQSRSAAGLPPQLQGYRTPGEKTLGEVSALMDAGMRKFIHKAEQFEIDLLEPMIRSEIILARENFVSMVEAQTVDENGLPTFLEVTEDDLKSNGVLVPIGARRFTLQNKQLNMINTLANSNLGQLVGTHLNSYALAQAVEDLGGLKEFKVFEQFAAIDEQAEMQQQAAIAEQQATSRLSEESMQEVLLS